MSRLQPTPPVVTCIYCGDEITIPGAILPTGASVCADCVDGELVPETAPTNENPEKGLSEVLSPPSAPVEVAPTGCSFTGCLRVKGHGSFHTTIESVAKHQDTREASEKALIAAVAKELPAALDRQQLARATSWREFAPEAGAQSLALEVEEWAWLVGIGCVATPADLHNALLGVPGIVESRFVVVLEWSRHDSGPTLRDIGPAFGHVGQTSDERQAALSEARVFALAEAKRLKAYPPYGYKPARQIPKV